MKIFKSINNFFTKSATVLEQAAIELDNATEAMTKRSEIRKKKALEEHKKAMAQLVIDGGYESEEAMNIAHQKRIDELRGN